ncbi:MAG TPA: hypothetical protein VK013_02940 [Myxococcaceae bacterium]|nr:hypothetical protein [Myxococcaceae bacterium]
MSTARTIRRTLTAAALLASGFALAGGGSINCPAGTQEIGGPKSERQASTCQKADGTLHGPYIGYDDEGRVITRGQVVNGFRDGTFTFYDADGVKTGETRFTRGNYDGKRVKYFANGKLRSEEFYVKGNREGTFRTFNKKGELVRQATYKADRRVASR